MMIFVGIARVDSRSESFFTTERTENTEREGTLLSVFSVCSVVF